MQIEYKRDLQNNYMILEAEAYADESEYMLKMAEQNEISGLLSFHSGKKDGRLFLYYEITSKQSIEMLYERNQLNSRDILFLLNGISQILEELQKYLLNPDYLLFHPQFIFTYPNKSKIFLCYLPGEKNYPITELAEFILKRLNHEDVQAVTLGYQFYKQTLEENFSLQLTLKEILLEQGEDLYKDWESEKVLDEESNAERRWSIGIDPNLDKERNKKNRKREQWNGEDNRGEAGNGGRKDWKPGGWMEEDEKGEVENGGKKERKISESWGGKNERGRKRAVESSARYDWENVNYSSTEKNGMEDELYEVTHKVRKRKSKYKAVADWLFERVHIGVIVSTLLLVALVELVFFLNWISLTEAGGIFFFIVSIEILINKFWRDRKEQKHANWWQESEEEYRNLQENMYQDELEQEIVWQEKMSAGNMERTVDSEETRCLIQEEDMPRQGIHLVYLNHANMQMNEVERYPDIIVSKEKVYVGKSGKDVDIVLNSDTISRIHAKLGVLDQKYYVRDLNSKNGTFVNGKKLLPQEQCEISEGDRIAFADILYHVVQL